jgi:hypothetical protein
VCHVGVSRVSCQDATPAAIVCVMQVIFCFHDLRGILFLRGSVEEIKLNVQAVEKHMESLSCNVGMTDHHIMTLEHRVSQVETSLLLSAATKHDASVETVSLVCTVHLTCQYTVLQACRDFF